VVADWEEPGLGEFLADPDVPAIFQAGGLQGRPQTAEFIRQHPS
jgi:hypothetical protein